MQAVIVPGLLYKDTFSKLVVVALSLYNSDGGNFFTAKVIVASINFKVGEIRSFSTMSWERYNGTKNIWLSLEEMLAECQ